MKSIQLGDKVRYKDSAGLSDMEVIGWKKDKVKLKDDTGFKSWEWMRDLDNVVNALPSDEKLSIEDEDLDDDFRLRVRDDQIKILEEDIFRLMMRLEKAKSRDGLIGWSLVILGLCIIFFAKML